MYNPSIVHISDPIQHFINKQHNRHQWKFSSFLSVQHFNRRIQLFHDQNVESALLTIPEYSRYALYSLQLKKNSIFLIQTIDIHLTFQFNLNGNFGPRIGAQSFINYSKCTISQSRKQYVFRISWALCKCFSKLI